MVPRGAGVLPSEPTAFEALDLNFGQLALFGSYLEVNLLGAQGGPLLVEQLGGWQPSTSFSTAMDPSSSLSPA